MKEEGEGYMSTRTYTVTGMSCGHCEASVRKEVGGVAGVQASTRRRRWAHWSWPPMVLSRMRRYSAPLPRPVIRRYARH